MTIADNIISQMIAKKAQKIYMPGILPPKKINCIHYGNINMPFL